MAKPAHIFIFVNASAGGNRAAEYLQHGSSEPLEVKEIGFWAYLRIYNIREGETGLKPGFLLVKELSKQVECEEDSIRVLVAGGDGTVMWALSELIKSEVDMTRVAVGHIPFGTGNDFARTTGWGHQPPETLVGAGKEYLYADMRRWINADISNFDMWQVDIQTAPSGGFLFIQGGKKVMTENHKVQHGLVESNGGIRMTKPMLNYFSFGFTGRAGIGFEKKRTTSKLRNIVRYGIEGVKKLLFRQPPKVSDVLQDLTIGGSANPCQGPTEPPTSTLQTIPGGALLETVDEGDEGPGTGTLSTIQTGALSTIQLDPSSQGAPHFQTVSADLLFINIPSYAGGADPWSWSSKTGLENNEASQEILNCKQDIGDGKLELLSYRSGLSASLDSVNSKARVPGRGGGRRIASDHGPFVAQFKPPELAKYKTKAGRVYFQIDGEFFIVTKPQKVVVSHWRTVRVLKCDDPPVRVGCMCAA